MRSTNEWIRSVGVAAILIAIGGTPLARASDARPPQAADAASVAPKGAAADLASKSVIPLCVPIGLASHKGKLFVANHWTAGGCGVPGQITVYSAKGVQIKKQTITADIYNPAGLAFDRKGNLYVADSTNDVVTVYDPTGKELKNRKLSTDPNYSASGVQVDSQGNVWVANRTNNNIGIGEIQIFHTDGSVQSFTTNLVYPVGIAFDPRAGNAWVGNSETPNDTITTYDSGGNFLKAHPTTNFTPTYLMFGKGGNAYVTDGLHSQVEIFKRSGKQTGSTITVGLALPYGIAPASQGDFYVANVGFGGNNNGSSIAKFTSSGTLICTIIDSGCN